MDLFILLLQKLAPLYAIIFLGFLAGKFLGVKKESIASLLIYIITPLVVLNGVVTTKITPSVISLPLLFFVLCSLMAVTFLYIGGKLWKDSTKNILAFTAGTGNTGYFGIPVALALFDQSVLGLVVLSILGFVLYENSVGFFITASGSFTSRQALHKVLRLPSLYAFFLGLIINFSGLHLGQGFFDAAASFRGAYTVLGMMIIGLAIASIETLKLDVKFISLSFMAKFVVWPLVVGLIIWLDNNYLHFYSPTIHNVMLLMAIVPLAANTVAYAAELKTQPEKAAIAVFFSTLLALVYIPFLALYFF
jgi:malate permease and related proteins